MDFFTNYLDEAYYTYEVNGKSGKEKLEISFREYVFCDETILEGSDGLIEDIVSLLGENDSEVS